MDQHETHAQRREKVQVVGEIEKAAIADDVAAEADDENLAPERMNVRRDGLKPVDEPVLRGQSLATRRRGGRVRRWFAAALLCVV
jgi:hypothetical protein